MKNNSAPEKKKTEKENTLDTLASKLKSLTISLIKSELFEYMKQYQHNLLTLTKPARTRTTYFTHKQKT